MKANKKIFEEEIVKAAPDMNKISAAQGATKALLSQMADNHLNMLLDIKKVLTPEQFSGYMALEKEEQLKKFQMHERFGPKHGFDKSVPKPQPPDEE